MTLRVELQSEIQDGSEFSLTRQLFGWNNLFPSETSACLLTICSLYQVNLTPPPSLPISIGAGDVSFAYSAKQFWPANHKNCSLSKQGNPSTVMKNLANASIYLRILAPAYQLVYPFPHCVNGINHCFMHKGIHRKQCPLFYGGSGSSFPFASVACLGVW